MYCPHIPRIPTDPLDRAGADNEDEADAVPAVAAAGVLEPYASSPKSGEDTLAVILLILKILHDLDVL